jgi:flagellar protein FliO/FliZ
MSARRPGTAAAWSAAASLFVTASAYAQNAVAPAPAPSVIGGSQIFSLFAGTVFVLAVIAGIAWMLKRIAPRGYGASNVLRVVAGTAVGQRERVVIVEVGASWLVVGVTPGSVNLLQQMPRIESAAAASDVAAPSTPFAAWLKQIMEKRNGS